MKELRRSGRVKCKGTVIEENTVDDAYSVEDDSSGDDFVKTTYVKGKGIELDDNGKKGTKRDSGAAKKRKKSDIIGDDNEKDKKVKREKGESSSSGTAKRLKTKKKKPYVFQTRTSPKALYNVIMTLKPIQKAWLARIGFADVLEFKCDGIPSKMGFYVVDNFSQHKMEIKLNERSIEITQESIGEMLGIRNEGVDIMEEEDANDEEMVQNWTKDGYIKSMVVTNTNDMVVATVLHKGFGEYLVRSNHNKAADVLKVEVKRENFYWQTDKKTYDSGVFLMCHMEAYMGNVMSKWECGLEAEGKKQNAQLGRLRKRYAVTLLLSECNLHRDIVRAQLNDIEVANVPGKRLKLPRVGK
ncbi:hypothetical protein Tco_0109899 [Tanacetum coccineum]